jgi:O-antigen/teichoic acid export membrane protein
MAFAQFIVLFSVGFYFGLERVGDYGIAQAITAPIFMLTNFGLRMGQCTDLKREHSANEYLVHRLVFSTFALLLILMIGIGFYPENNLVLLVALVKYIESVSDILYGDFLRRERANLVGQSLTISSAVSSALFVVSIYLTLELAFSIFIVFLTKLAVLILFDLNKFKQFNYSMRLVFDFRTIKKISENSYSLSLGALFASLIVSMPRLLLETFSSLSAVGILTYCGYVLTGTGMVINSILHPIMPKASRMLRDTDLEAFYSLTKKLITLFSMLTLAFCLLVFISEGLLANQVEMVVDNPKVFIISTIFLVLVNGIYALISHLNLCLRYFKIHLYSLLVSLLFGVIIALYFVSQIGLVGAILSWAASLMFYVFISSIFSLRKFRFSRIVNL